MFDAGARNPGGKVQLVRVTEAQGCTALHSDLAQDALWMRIRFVTTLVSSSWMPEIVRCEPLVEEPPRRAVRCREGTIRDDNGRDIGLAAFDVLGQDVPPPPILVGFTLKCPEFSLYYLS